MTSGPYPDKVELTREREQLLDLLSDGEWHDKFIGIGIPTFDFMQNLGFIEVRSVDSNPSKRKSWRVKARITKRGRFLLDKRVATMKYERDPGIYGYRPTRITVEGMPN